MLEHLREIRLSKGYTCSQMAKVLGITKATYSKKERGKIIITLTEARKIALLFGGNIEDIFFDKSVSLIDTQE